MTAAPTPPRPRAGVRPKWLLTTTAAGAAVVLAASLVLASRGDGTRGGPASGPPRPVRTATSTTVPPTATSVVPPPTGLGARMAQLWRRTPGGCLAVAVGGRTVFAERAEEPVAPASTMKVATATAVLARIGPDVRLTTTVVAGAPLADGGVVAGDLWLVGGGDPVLATDAWAARSRPPALHTSLDALADAVVARGVRTVTGRLLGDDSRYDAMRQVPTWSAHVADSNEVGPLSALTVNDGFRAWTGEHGEPFPDAATGAAATLVDLLAARGVEVRGGAGAGRAPSDGAVPLASQASPPVVDLVQAMLRDSDNGTAELLLKELGRRVLGDGSTAAGARAATEVLGAMGLSTAGVRIVDGSGLDAGNRATCAFFIALLNAIPDDGVVADGLPVAARTGTLERRFVGTPVAGRVRAKTGSLDGVAALVGYSSPPTGPTVAFAYLVEGIASDAEGRRLYEELAALLVDG